MKSNRILTVLVILGAFMAGVWAVEYRTGSAQVQPTDFNANLESDYPDLTNIDLEIKGLASYGKIFMLEGIESTTSATPVTGSFKAGDTSYPRLVLHGVFDKLIRAWRDEVISGKSTTRNIQLDLRNKAGSRVLRIMFYNAMPVKFSIPPLSIENNTRYMERLEFVYSYFDITN